MIDMLNNGGAVEMLRNLWFYVQIFIGFSVIIFFHELGHFLVAKWAGVKVEQFAIGFFREVFGFTHGETRYSFNLLPLGGYVKMMGQEDFEVDSTGELQRPDDPRSFVNKPVGHRMAIVSAGVIMNLLLAAVLFMIVFMAGMEVPAPRIGAVVPDSPAAMAGLLAGDRVLSIDGDEINEFNEISMAVLLAKPGNPLDFEVERGGQVQHVFVEPQRNERIDLLQVGITTGQSAELVAVGPEYKGSNPSHPRPGDRIVEFDGQPVTDANANDMMNLLLTNPLGIGQIIVERVENPADPESATTRVPIQIVPRLVLQPTDPQNPPHVLGLSPLIRASSVTPGGRADLAGIKVGDVVLKWDDIEYPSPTAIRKNMVANSRVEERDIPLQLLRDGKVHRVVLRPRVKVSPLTRKRAFPDPGASFDMFADDLLRVAAVVPEVYDEPTPAAKAGIPAGATITQVNDEPVQRWIDLTESLRRHAGETVQLTYVPPGGEETQTQMAVPRSIRTVLGLGPESQIVAVDGKDKAQVTINGNTAPFAITYQVALRAALRANVGKTVEIKYRPDPLAPLETAEVTITEDMTEPWLGLMKYTIDLVPAMETRLLRKTNPIAAIQLGAKKTYYFVYQVYQTIERMLVSRSLSAEKISGPVGILKIGRQISEAGWVQLFFFLAIISANLAVINFLPLPIVDGGHMVFLIIEKIKGSPISIRVQVATQVIGLILIGSAFIFVTIQDLAR